MSVLVSVSEGCREQDEPAGRPWSQSLAVPAGPIHRTVLFSATYN